MPVTKLEVLKRELKKLGNFDGDDEARNVAFINAMCSALQKNLLEYYGAGNSAEDRLARLGEITLMFRESKKGELSIRGIAVHGDSVIGVDGNYGCPDGTQCIDGICL